MSTNIKIRNSAVSGNVPSTLLPGELALGRADGKLFYSDAANNIQYFQKDDFSTVVANGTPLFATTAGDILTVSPESANAITITANASAKSFTIGLDEDNIHSFVRKVGDTMTGDLHIDTANVYTNVLTANTIDFVDANGSGNLYVAGAITGPTIQAIDDYANAAYETANAAFAFANSAVMEVAVTDETSTSNNSSNTYFLTFTDKTNATVNSVFTNVDVLTYTPETGKLSSNTLSANTIYVSNVSTITSNTVTLMSLDPTVIDSLDVYSFRSSLYDFQIENGLDSHMINFNLLNGDSSAAFTVFGETFTYDSLGTFSANVSSTKVNVIFTPNYVPATVSFLRRSMMRLGIEYPSVDQGLVRNPFDHILDLGYVAIIAEFTVDYGNLGVAGSGAEPVFSRFSNHCYIT